MFRFTIADRVLFKIKFPCVPYTGFTRSQCTMYSYQIEEDWKSDGYHGDPNETRRICLVVSREMWWVSIMQCLHVRGRKHTFYFLHIMLSTGHREKNVFVLYSQLYNVLIDCLLNFVFFMGFIRLITVHYLYFYWLGVFCNSIYIHPLSKFKVINGLNLKSLWNDQVSSACLA